MKPLSILLFAFLLTGCRTPEQTPQVGEVWHPRFSEPQPFFPVETEVVVLKVCGEFVLVSYTGSLHGYRPRGMAIEAFHKDYNYARPDTALVPCP